jgi:chromate transport protein ChrA
MLMEYGISVSTFMAATIGALVVAKVILIVDLLPWVNRYPDKPLIYNVAWKTAIYLLASLLVHFVEHLVPFVRHHENLATATRHLIAETIWPHFWAVQMWLLLLLFVYCALRELIRALGREQVLHMFFGTPRRTAVH